MINLEKKLKIHTVMKAINELEKITNCSTKKQNRLYAYKIRHNKSNIFIEFTRNNWKELKLYNQVCVYKLNENKNKLVFIHPLFIIQTKIDINKFTKKYDFVDAIYSITDTSNLFVYKLSLYFSDKEKEQKKFYNKYIKIYKLNMNFCY